MYSTALRIIEGIDDLGNPRREFAFTRQARTRRDPSVLGLADLFEDVHGVEIRCEALGEESTSESLLTHHRTTVACEYTRATKNEGSHG